MGSDKKDDHYHYSTAEITKYYDLTPRGLAYYEDQGIISPQRRQDSKYRIYTLEDCYALYHSKLYRNIGFSLKETASLLKEHSLEQILEMTSEKCAEGMHRLAVQKRALEQAQKMISILKEDQEKGQSWCLENRPAFYRFYVRNYDWKHVSTPAQSREFALWNEYIPIDSASLLYDHKCLVERDAHLNVNIANIIEEEDLQLLRFDITENVEYIPSATCIRTLIRGLASEIDRIGWLNSTLDWLDAHEYTLSGPVLTRMLMVWGMGKESMRCDMAWFPVKKR